MTAPRFYGLDGEPITAEQYGQLAGDLGARRVAADRITYPGGVLVVSTVWLGINHNFDDGGPPLIYETMVFADEESFEETGCWRYPTRDAAEQGHEAVVEKVTRELAGKGHTPARVPGPPDGWPA